MSRFILAGVVLALMLAPSVAGSGEQVPDALVFVRGGDVYRMYVDGSETVRLTATRVAKEAAPAASAAALRVAFIRGEDELWTMDLQGGNLRRVLAARPASVSYASTGSPSWSADGRSLYVDRVSQTPNEICGSVYRVATVGGTPKRVTPGVVKGSLDTDPAVSPDGRYIVLSVGDCQPGFGADLAVVSVAGRPTRDLRKLPPTPGIQTDPTWAPDGKRIAFVAYDADGSGRSAVYAANRDGSGLRRLSRWSVRVGNPSWSPDGDSIVFQDQAGLFVIRPDGTGLERIVGTKPGDGSPSWIPRS